MTTLIITIDTYTIASLLLMGFTIIVLLMLGISLETAWASIVEIVQALTKHTVQQHYSAKTSLGLDTKERP